jgi:hypothetical protein
MAPPTSCNCPDVNDQDWHLKDQDWSGKFFYFEYVRHLFNIPLGYDKQLQAMKRDLARKGYQLVTPDMVLHQPGAFQGRILMEIKDPEQYDANVESFDNARILSRVYRGPRSSIGSAVQELKAFTQDRAHLEPIVVYYWQTTCKRCAKTKGYEKTILFARV